MSDGTAGDSHEMSDRAVRVFAKYVGSVPIGHIDPDEIDDVMVLLTRAREIEINAALPRRLLMDDDIDLSLSPDPKDRHIAALEAKVARLEKAGREIAELLRMV